MTNLADAVVHTWERPWMYPKQEEALFNPARFAITEASTKSGKTVGCIVWLLEKALTEGQPGRSYWWIAPVYAQARIAYNRMKLGSRQVQGLVASTNDADLVIRLFNGAVVEFKSAENPDNLYGENVFAAVLDEVTRMRETAWFAIRSTLTATNGPARLIGNVKGKKNWAYKIARRAQMGSLGGWHYSKISAYDAVAANVLKAEEIAGAKEELPEAVYRELYEAEASDDEGNPFGLKFIAACMTPTLSAARLDVLGWDLGKRTDFTVGTGLDAVGAMCHWERFKLNWETVHNRLEDTSPYARRVIIDSTGVGDPVVERAQRSNGNIEGFTFGPASKQRLMEGLAVAIQQNRIRIYDDPEEINRTELESFEYEYTRTGVRYSAPEGMHDDFVISLGLAVLAHGMGSDTVYDIEALIRAAGGDTLRAGPLGPPPSEEQERAREGDFRDTPNFGGNGANGMKLGGW